MNHHDFLAVVEQCKTERGARAVVAAVRSFVLADRSPPLSNDVTVADRAIGQLAQSVQLWTNAVRTDHAVHAVLHALDAIEQSDTGMERARVLLHAMLLSTGERATEQRRYTTAADSSAQFAMYVDDEATPGSN